MQLKQILLAGLLLIAGNASAQLLYPMFSDSNLRTNLLEVDGIADYQATSIKRELSGKLVWGGYIDNDVKDRSLKKHGDVNRIGGNLNSEVRYIHGGGHLFKWDSLTWMVKGGYTAVGNLNYATDAFELIFYGNGNYIGGTADFSNTRLDFARFQKIGFGVVGKKYGSSLTLNFVNVQDYADGYVRKGELTQNDDGSQVDLLLEGDFRTTTGSQFSKGMGVSLDLDYRILVPWGKTKTTFQVMAQNVGFAYMFAGLDMYSVDSSYSYSGFDFDMLTDGSDPFGDDFSVLDSLGIDHSMKKRVVALPGYLQVAKLVDPLSEKKVQSFFGLRLYPTFSSIPQVFAGAYWKAAGIFHVSGALTYGGFGNLRGGLFASLNFDRVHWMIGTEDVFGSVSSAGFGSSVVTRLLWKLN